jgi:predicted transglutaminase-like cysteine proteinase
VPNLSRLLDCSDPSLRALTFVFKLAPSSTWLYGLLLLLAAAALLFSVERAAAIDYNRLLATYSKMRGNDLQPFRDWQAMLKDSQGLSTNDKLQRVNDFFNRRIQFGEDINIWGQTDYWATPMETLSKGAGDCEDFAIAKYFSLLVLGVPMEQLRLIYVKARLGGASSNVLQAHMVLAYYPSPDAEPQVLDNLINSIRPSSRRPDLTPVFSFNGQGVFAGAGGDAALGAGGVGKLSVWADLLKRAKEEGFD